ncbi:MAG: hypothetical protein GVY13_05980 [Alphaproteobacteria bacterium]|jgi:predicted Zn finger-like uncharacterized protein|nr:hypothetical protein [Alphaproteobacteria bacterium]
MAMILSCPNCQTRFSLDAAALGRDGRKVKCTRCGEVWFQAPAGERPLAAPAGPAAALAEAAGGSDAAARVPAATTAPTDAEEPGPDRARRSKAGGGSGASRPASAGGSRRAAAAGWVLLALLVIGLGAALFAGRDAVVNAWPPAWRLYATLGLDVPAVPAGPAVAPYAGLSFVDVVPRWAEAAGTPVLMVSGGLVNGGAGLARIPLFEARFLDEAGEMLDTRPVDPGFARLDPGETQLFEMALAEPHPGTHRIELVFATGRSMTGSGS